MSRILIIDDDPDLVSVAEIYLNSAGYEVSSANNKNDGRKAVNDIKPDLILLDVMMDTEDDGITLAQDLRRDGVQTPIIMLTSMGTITGMEFGRDNEIVPVDEFLNKPVDSEVLIEKVKKYIG
ncbi:MAG: response regulator [Firmicutes bacterium]|nr:response regulator [Bacillota bacterium]